MIKRERVNHDIMIQYLFKMKQNTLNIEFKES